MASRKTTVIDLLNEYLAKGQMPPKEILQQAAELEGGQGTRVNPLVDPVTMLTGGTGFGAGLARLAPDAGQIALNELFGFGLGEGVPKLLKMAPTPQSGLAMPIGGPATSDLAGGKTAELLPKGIKLPGGAVAAKGTSPLADEDFPDKPVVNPTAELSGQFNPLKAFVKEADKTGKLNEADADSIISTADQIDPNWAEKTNLPGTPEDVLWNSLFKQGNVTGPLPPQGAATEMFGQEGDTIGPASALMGKLKGAAVNPWGEKFKNASLQTLPAQPKTEPLTPFEAHWNVTPDHPAFEGADVTKALMGAAGPFPDSFKAHSTAPLGLTEGNRTASLEPQDIEEMSGRETPPTEDLLAALAKNLGPKDTRPLPENTIYHGLNVFGQKPRKEALASISEQGLKGGWFSEEPHQPFGPHFIATRPEDLPPLLIRQKQFNIDPEKEIIPRWKQMNTENLETAMRLRGKAPGAVLSPDEVKGRPALRSSWPNIHQLVGADEGGGGFPLEKGGNVVPPEKLFLTNKVGDVIGRMAPKGGKPNALNSVMDRARAFRNVLEKGTSQAANSVNSVFHELFGGDPEFKGADKATKVAKLKQFVAQPEPENPALAKIWKPFMDKAMAALVAAGEDIPK